MVWPILSIYQIKDAHTNGLWLYSQLQYLTCNRLNYSVATWCFHARPNQYHCGNGRLNAAKIRKCHAITFYLIYAYFFKKIFNVQLFLAYRKEVFGNTLYFQKKSAIHPKLLVVKKK